MTAIGAVAAPAERPIHRGWITLTTVLATTLQTIDTTIANVALPHMQGAMSATLSFRADGGVVRRHVGDLTIIRK